MRLLAGLLAPRAGRGVWTGLEALTRELQAQGAQAELVEGGVGLVSTLGSGSRIETDEVLGVADLDLTNLAELQAAAGEPGRPEEVVARLYGRDGPGFVKRLRGAFALAIWDRRARRLLLAVDRFGIRRLCYGAGPAGFAFASRATAVPRLAGIAGEVDPTAIYHYLNLGYVPAPESSFAGVRRLPPGHLLTWEGGEPGLARYWDLAYPERPQPEDAAARATARLVQEAVSVSLADTTPKETGAFLSGGTDSSTIVGLMAKVTGERVHAFSMGFSESQYDERSYAELAARHFGAQHHTAVVTADDALAALPDVVRAYDEPFGNDSTLATYLCARLAREAGMVRLLAGDGGDEVFGGNERYRTDRVFAAYARVPRWLRRGLIEPLLAALPDGGRTPLGRARRYVRRASLPTARRFYSYEFLVAQEAGRLLQPDFVRAVDPDGPWRVVESHFDAARAGSELNRLLYLDIKLTIGDCDLYKVTRTAELAGLDVRFPMLDHPLVEFTGTLPARYKVNGLEKRYLFKRAFADLLPHPILAKTKHGFGVPVAKWIRSHPGFRELARASLLDRGSHLRAYFRPDALAELVRLQESDHTSYYGQLLWRLVMLDLWHREHRPAVGR